MLITSENITAITAALIEFRKIIGPLVKDATAKGDKFSYKFATLQQLLDLVVEPLLDNGIMLMQPAEGFVQDGEGVTVVTTRLQHVSGEYMETMSFEAMVEERKGLSLMQSAGMNVTYCRRYQLMSLLGISPEEDTDAGLGTGNTRAAMVRDAKAGYPSREERGPSQIEEDNEPFIPY